MNKLAIYVLIGIFAFVLLSNTAISISWAPEASEIPFQVNHSDRIVIGTVKELRSSFDFIDVLIRVDEWLKNPLPKEEIIVRIGRPNIGPPGVNFSVGEKALLMLKDVNAEKGKFSMPFMELGKRPVSDRDAVIKAITEQEKAKAVEIARNNPKIKVLLSGDAELIAVEKPSYTERKDIYDVIFRWNNSYGVYRDTIAVNLTSKNVEGAVSIRVKSLEETSTSPVAQEEKTLDNQKAIALTKEEKAKAIEIAISDPKVKESLPTDAEVIAVEIPPFAGKNDRIYNVIFKHGEFHDIITVNLTSGNVENSVSIRGEYQPKVEDLPMPVFREDVIVYFKEMPVSLEEFASKYDGKLIFAKQDIKLAAFETNPVGRPGEVSKATLNFINEVSKNPLVEKAFHDGFMFTRPDKEYLPEPKLTYPEDMRDEYVPNEVIVGFWRFPPSLEDFAYKYSGKLMNFDDANNVLLSAKFETSNITEFIKKISTNPYVRYAEPNGIGRIAELSANNASAAMDSEATDMPKAPGFGAILAVLLLLSMIYIMKRGN